MKRIAIQGVPGSYHDIAAHKYFKDEDIELICCNTFEDVFGEMKRIITNYCAIAEPLLSANTNCASAIASCACPAKIGVP